jgi:metal-sulfur cluster biosynthetic enzyme
MAKWSWEAPVAPAVEEPVQQGSPMSVQGWLDKGADTVMIADLLHQVIDPEVGVNVVDLGLIYAIRVSEDTASIRMSLTTPGCPLSAYMEDSIQRLLWGTPGIENIDLQIIWEPAWSTEMMSERAKRELGWAV